MTRTTIAAVVMAVATLAACGQGTTINPDARTCFDEDCPLYVRGCQIEQGCFWWGMRVKCADKQRCQSLDEYLATHTQRMAGQVCGWCDPDAGAVTDAH